MFLTTFRKWILAHKWVISWIKSRKLITLLPKEFSYTGSFLNVKRTIIRHLIRLRLNTSSVFKVFLVKSKTIILRNFQIVSSSRMFMLVSLTLLISYWKGQLLILFSRPEQMFYRTSSKLSMGRALNLCCQIRWFKLNKWSFHWGFQAIASFIGWVY